MIAVTSPLSTPSSTARSTVRANICRSASCSTSRARNELNVVAPIPATSSPTPSAARQSRSTLLRRRLHITGLVMGGQQQRPHHHRGGNRRAAPAQRVAVREVLVGHQLVAVRGQPLIERAWGYPVAMRQVTHALPVHPPEHAHLRRPRQRAESSPEPCPTVQSLEPVAFLLAHLGVASEPQCYQRAPMRSLQATIGCPTSGLPPPKAPPAWL